MPIVIERDVLLGALRQVADVVETRNTIAVLGNVLMRAEGGAMTIVGTDLDIEAQASVAVEGDMAVTVDAQKIIAAVASFKEGAQVSIAPVDGRAAITLSSGRGKRTLSTLPVTDFPQRKEPATTVTFDIRADILRRLLDATHIAVSSEETRYYLCGVFLHVAGEHLVAVATDGHRLVRARTSVPDGASAMQDIIVPAKTVRLLRGKMLAKAEDEVRIAVGERFIAVEIDGAKIVSKLVDGHFPDYSRVIPTEDSTVLSIDREALIDAIGGVASIVNAEGERKMRVAKIDLSASGTHGISARDTSGSAAEEEVVGDLVGDPHAFGINHKYATQTLGIFAEGARLSLSIASPTAPMRATSDKDPDLLAVIMPMRA